MSWNFHTSTKVVVYIGGTLGSFSVTAAVKHFFKLFPSNSHSSSSPPPLEHAPRGASWSVEKSCSKKRKQKCYPQSWKRMCMVELATRVLCISQRVSKFQSTSPKLMWFVDHVRIGGASAQSLGVDTRSPNGDDHWWDTHVKREKRNKRRHTANFISTSSFPQKSPQEYFFIDAVRIWS